jgi:hypothetical protein
LAPPAFHPIRARLTALRREQPARRLAEESLS